MLSLELVGDIAQGVGESHEARLDVDVRVYFVDRLLREGLTSQ